ncbi:methyltransferase [Streptomyces gibsoniae]|uniref:Methyltransferase n=1 Tax=Streptomyces gibsoniae TaxID=3075529 RepID=A0ABU2TU30_9ACTN|nr:methyltransferase [Streptomyces sp. DSM 41699]MDT0464464.1 methyltransferase [Streptomyces sp. DSM 41699]
MTISPAPDQWHGQSPTPISPADAYNGYIAANVIFALDRLGLLDRIERGDVLYREDLGRQPAADTDRAEAVLRAAVGCGYLKAEEGVFLPTETGREAARTRGYFTWAVGGYSEVFAHAGSLSAGTARYDEDVHRDEAMVALGSGQADRSMFAGLLHQVLADVDFEAVADLGSGTSARVQRVVSQRPGTRGFGIDISEPATRLARQDIVRAGLEGRVEAIRGDVLDILAGGRDLGAVADVDTVMSFLLLHDLLADPKTRPDVLPRMREAFPRSRTFIFADTMLRPDTGAEDKLPIFSAGFELAHAMMGVPLHTKDTYEDLFRSAGLRIARTEAMATPHSWLYVLAAD